MPVGIPSAFRIVASEIEPVVSLWERLKRSENGMPFTDDLGLSALSNLSGKPFLLSVSAPPERFRFEVL